MEAGQAATPDATDPVLYGVDDAVATITLNRPDRLNAWTPELGSLYFDLLDRAAADPAVRVILVTGAGRGFCAGADMESLQAIGKGESSGGAPDPRPQSHPLTIPKPIVGAINGACAGLGFVLALMCDVRFAAAGAKFTTAFSRRGLVAEHGSSWVLPRLIGHSKALELLFSGRVFLAEEALDLGVVNRVVPAGDLLDEARAWAHDVATNCSPSAMAAMKKQIYSHWRKDLGDAIDESNVLMVKSLGEHDFREGVASFVEKRPPKFHPVPND